MCGYAGEGNISRAHAGAPVSSSGSSVGRGRSSSSGIGPWSGSGSGGRKRGQSSSRRRWLWPSADPVGFCGVSFAATLDGPAGSRWPLWTLGPHWAPSIPSFDVSRVSTGECNHPTAVMDGPQMWISVELNGKYLIKSSCNYAKHILLT